MIQPPPVFDPNQYQQQQEQQQQHLVQHLQEPQLPYNNMNNIITPEDSETAMNLLSMATSSESNPILDEGLQEETLQTSSAASTTTEPQQTSLQQQQTDMDIVLSLMMACRSGDLEEVKRCVSTGRVDINEHDPKSIYGVCNYSS